MKKAVVLFLQIILFNNAFSQEVYENISTNETYLFVGSIEGDKIKVLNLENKSTDWVDYKKLNQTDRFSSQEFINRIFDNDLYFEAGGDEPFWNMEVRKNTLQFIGLNGRGKRIPIKIEVNKSDIDNSLLFMFHNKDKTVYGLIRGLKYSTEKQSFCTLCTCEETSFFEVFVNYAGNVYKGCATITKE